jgi:hypothetical protein
VGSAVPRSPALMSLTMPLPAASAAPQPALDTVGDVEERTSASAAAASAYGEHAEGSISPVLQANGEGESEETNMLVSSTPPPPSTTPAIAADPPTEPAAAAAAAVTPTSTEPPDFPSERPPQSGYTLFVLEFNQAARDKVCALVFQLCTNVFSLTSSAPDTERTHTMAVGSGQPVCAVFA